MSISTTYSPKEIEDKWYRHWMEQDFFSSKPDTNKEPFTIVIPPPNVTGVLHMGHMLNNTIQDVLVRKARMEGKEACWVPGTDHASIATEARVVAMLKEKGINKKDISREEFLKYAFEWKEKYGGIILEQLKKLGASCDWSRTKFTMDEDMTKSVIRVFVDLFEKGHIYRGVRMVNWDPVGRTAISDDEVIHREVSSKLYYVKYKVESLDTDTEEIWMTIATTRPETILGDTGVCVHPSDMRYQHLIGRKAIIPFVNRPVPIIADDYIDIEFGTGCLKVTPAHDINDYEIGLRHNLQVIDTIADDGTMSEAAEFYVGEDRFIVRKKIAKDLDAMGHLVKVEDIVNKNGYSERTDAVIEPKLSLQWFLKMDELSKPALENVMNDVIKLQPPKFKNMYRNWMENVRDWCISRQLWWGQQIPAFYLNDGRFVVAETVEEAVEKARELTQNNTLTAADLRQDADVLDTWFSSWLWPISVFNGILEPDNEEVKYYYPTNDLVTAPEILFFWVARMIIAGYEYRDEKPFENVYLTGIVRDAQGRKMSKSLGNSPDPLDLIAQYGADGVRAGMLFSSPAGNDLLFDVKLCEQGRNFSNKIWNAFRLIKGWEIDDSLSGQKNEVAIQWINARIDETLLQIEDHYKKYRISDALMSIYKLIWDDFCSWYLEMVKPAYQQPIDRETYNRTIDIFEKLIKILHPFMPFITEELWHNLRERSATDCLIVAPYPTAERPDHDLLDEAKDAFEVITGVRNVRNAKQIAPKEQLELLIRTDNRENYWAFESAIVKLANLSKLDYVTEKVENASTFVMQGDEFYVPLSEHLDEEQERERLTKEIAYLQGFLKSVKGKLSNERFVANAPEEVVQNERNKQEDAEAKIKSLEESLAGLENQTI